MKIKFGLLLLISLFISVFAIVIFNHFYHKPNIAGVATSADYDNVSGLIISHHDLTREYIIRSLDKISQLNDYDYIVIIGPNHFYPNETAYLTSTDLENFTISYDMVQKLVTFKDDILNDKDRVEKEHSINIPASYIKDFFPNAKIIPLVIPQYFDANELKDIALFLTNTMPEKTLYVASVDFSHGTTVLEAESKNTESETAIKNFDFDKIYAYKSDHMDSPGSVGLLLNIMKNLGTTKWDLWFDTHGAFIEDTPTLQGTSYLFGVFTK